MRKRKTKQKKRQLYFLKENNFTLSKPLPKMLSCFYYIKHYSETKLHKKLLLY